MKCDSVQGRICSVQWGFNPVERGSSPARGVSVQRGFSLGKMKANLNKLSPIKQPGCGWESTLNLPILTEKAFHQLIKLSKLENIKIMGSDRKNETKSKHGLKFDHWALSNLLVTKLQSPNLNGTKMSHMSNF